MQRPQGSRAGVAQRLTVDGDVRQVQGLTGRRDPGTETALKGNGVQTVEETLEGIVRWDAVGQGEEASQPRLPTLGPGNDFRPGIGAAQDGADGDHDDVQQQV